MANEPNPTIELIKVTHQLTEGNTNRQQLLSNYRLFKRILIISVAIVIGSAVIVQGLPPSFVESTLGAILGLVYLGTLGVMIYSIIRVISVNRHLGEIEQQIKKLNLEKDVLESRIAAKAPHSVPEAETSVPSQGSTGTNGQTHATNEHAPQINLANTADATPTIATQPEYVSQRAELRLKLTTNFGEEELRTLCFDLDVDYESISDTNKDIFVRELLILFDRRGHLQQLTAYCKKLRPNIDWEIN